MTSCHNQVGHHWPPFQQPVVATNHQIKGQ